MFLGHDMSFTSLIEFEMVSFNSKVARNFSLEVGAILIKYLCLRPITILFSNLRCFSNILYTYVLYPETRTMTEVKDKNSFNVH